MFSAWTAASPPSASTPCAKRRPARQRWTAPASTCCPAASTRTRICSCPSWARSSSSTPYFQIGESKYGKPIIDRVISYETTPLDEAAKCTLVSFDSTIRSNLSVGLPIDMLMLRANRFEQAMKPPHRIGRDDPYFLSLRDGWSKGLREVFDELPNEPWFDS